MAEASRTKIAKSVLLGLCALLIGGAAAVGRDRCLWVALKSVSVSPSTVSPGGPVTVTFSFNGTESPWPYEHVWVAAVLRGPFIVYEITDKPGCSSNTGSLTFTAPTAPGTYTYYLHAFGDAQSQPIDLDARIRTWGGNFPDDWAPFTFTVAAAPAPSPTLSPPKADSACDASRAVYYENFEDGQAQGWNLGADWSVFREPGGNQVLRGRERRLASYGGGSGSQWGDLTLQLRVKIIQGAMSVILRTGSRGSYSVSFSLTGVEVAKQLLSEAMRYTPLQKAYQNRVANQWYTLQISARGGRLEAFIDGVLVLSYTDSDPLPAGGIGLETDTNAEVYVDDIMVCP